jgi:branched-chain amino acid transport system permease protein
MREMRLSGASRLLGLALLVGALMTLAFNPSLGPVRFGFPIDIYGFRIGIFTASLVAIWAIAALGLNILTGYNGQISLGHGAFVLVGAYTSALFMDRLDWPFWSTIILAGMVAGAAGFVVGIPALRLTGPYLAIATLSLAIVTPQVIIKYRDFTGGPGGVAPGKPPPPPLLDEVLTRDQWLYLLALFTAVLMTLLAWNLVRSRFGRAFVAIRDSEPAAAAMGVGVARYKVMAFAISAFYAGIAGGLYTQLVGSVFHDSVGILDSLNFFALIVVGGLASILGSVLGAVFFVVSPEMSLFLRDTFGLGFAVEGRLAISGALLIMTMIFAPHGIAGAIREMGSFRPRLLLQPAQAWYRRLSGQQQAASGDPSQTDTVDDIDRESSPDP